jgi:hypothetical protein
MNAPERSDDDPPRLDERAEARLDERAEALLDGWPAPARGALEWEDAAGRTMARVRETTLGSTPGALLDAPLPVESHEESLSVPPAKEEPTLADIARTMLAPEGGETSKSVAREVLLAAEEERRSAPPRPFLRADEEYWRSGSAEPRASSREGRPVHATHETTARSDFPARDRRATRSQFGIVALGGGAALALAAGAVLYVSMQSRAARGVVTEPSAEAPRAVTASAGAAVVATASATTSGAHAVTLDVLPVDSEEAKTNAASGRTTTADHAGGLDAPGAGTHQEALAFHVKRAPADPSKLVLEEREDNPAPAPAAPAPAPPTKGPSSGDFAPETPGLPPQPSLGAVQAAVGSVMTGARSCLAGQDSGSKATVKFAPTGQVASVAIAGPAAGTPAESCVRSALMGARVPPFSEPSFSASLTIRPP